jgi:hypothetical protein
MLARQLWCNSGLDTTIVLWFGYQCAVDAAMQESVRSLMWFLSGSKINYGQHLLKSDNT